MHFICKTPTFNSSRMIMTQAWISKVNRQKTVACQRPARASNLLKYLQTKWWRSINFYTWISFSVFICRFAAVAVLPVDGKPWCVGYPQDVSRKPRLNRGMKVSKTYSSLGVRNTLSYTGTNLLRSRFLGMSLNVPPKKRNIVLHPPRLRRKKKTPITIDGKLG